MNPGAPSHSRRAAGAAALAVATLCGVAIVAGPHGARALAATRPDFSAAAKGIVEALDIQTAFPDGSVTMPPASLLSDLDFARAPLWIAVAVGAAVIALYLRDILPGGRRARRGDWSAQDAAGGTAGAGALAAAQTDADELARLGRFVEAMHVLLLQALADMRGRLDQRIADSLTSREILGRASVPPVARSALRELIGAVERAYFGDHPVGESDYRACRAQFATFVGALGEGRGA